MTGLILSVICSTVKIRSKQASCYDSVFFVHVCIQTCILCSYPCARYLLCILNGTCSIVCLIEKGYFNNKVPLLSMEISSKMNTSMCCPLTLKGLLNEMISEEEYLKQRIGTNILTFQKQLGILSLEMALEPFEVSKGYMIP